MSARCCSSGIPKQADLERELFYVKQKWYNIGLQLGVSDNRLEEIDCECGKDFERGLRLMLREWRKQIDPEADWKALVEALRQCTVNELDLASNLEGRYVSYIESTDLDQPQQSASIQPAQPYPLDCPVVMKPEEVPDPEVQKQLTHLYDMFEELVMNVYTYLSTKPLDLKEFAVLVSSQPPSWQVKRPKLIPDVHFERIIDPSIEFYQIFCIVRRYVSWHNYELVEKIIKRYGDSNLKQQMENYCCQLNNFEEHTSAEVLINIQFATAQADSVALLAVLPDHHCNQFTARDIRQFKHKITDKASLEHSALRTLTITKSSVKIIFLIPRALAPYVIVSSLPIAPLLTTHGPLPESISDRAVYTMHTDEVFHIMERIVLPPALQKSSNDANTKQMCKSASHSSRLHSSASESSRLADLPLSTIDPSLIQLHHHKVIMKGDNAVICKAQFLSLPCAAKYVHPELAKSPLSWQVDSFNRGCQLLQGLCHPNLVTILGICNNESIVGPIILMEKMEQNLNDFLNKGPLLLHSQIDILSDVGQGLEYLHASNVVHGNLTATNVLMKGGRAKICGVTSLQCNSTDAEMSVGSGAAVSLPRAGA